MAEHERARLAEARYREKHREELRERDRQRYIANRQQIRGRANELADQRRTLYGRTSGLRVTKTEWRRRVLEVFGGKCARCGFDDWRALQIDHVNGDGRLERASRKDRQAFYKEQVTEPDFTKYQLLCANCNWIKRYENGEHR